MTIRIPHCIRALALVGTLVVPLPLASTAAAAPPQGSLLADFVLPANTGFGVAFDGRHVFWLDENGDRLHRSTPQGVMAASIPISGCTAEVISWDPIRQVFWSARGTVISQITMTGACTSRFDVADKLIGDCGGDSCSAIVDGLDYDPATDSLWYSPVETVRIYHFTPDGMPADPSYLDVDRTPNHISQECGFSANSGVASGAGGILFLSVDGCAKVFQFSQAGTKLGAFDVVGGSHRDMECDALSFAAQDSDAVWIKDGVDGHLRAFAVTRGSCAAAPPPPPPPMTDGRMTGGGSVLDAGRLRTTHGFTLQCDPNRAPQRLQINWGKGQRFHLERLVSADCSDTPAINPAPPGAGFDRYAGSGRGRLNGRPGASATWVFTDAGEPGVNDHAEITVRNADGEVVLDVAGRLSHGNHQSHRP